MTKELAEILFIGLSGLLFLGAVRWAEEGLRDYFEHIAKIDSKDYERKNRRD